MRRLKQLIRRPWLVYLARCERAGLIHAEDLSDFIARVRGIRQTLRNAGWSHERIDAFLLKAPVVRFA